jgi:hypothetical protein
MSLNPDTVIQTTHMILEVETVTPAVTMPALPAVADVNHKRPLELSNLVQQ